MRVATCCVLLLLVCCLLRVVCCVLLVFSAWCLVVFGVCLFVLVVAVLAVLAVVDLAGGDCASDPRKNTDKLHAETWQKLTSSGWNTNHISKRFDRDLVAKDIINLLKSSSMPIARTFPDCNFSAWLNLLYLHAMAGYSQIHDLPQTLRWVA